MPSLPSVVCSFLGRVNPLVQSILQSSPLAIIPIIPSPSPVAILLLPFVPSYVSILWFDRCDSILPSLSIIRLDRFVINFRIVTIASVFSLLFLLSVLLLAVGLGDYGSLFPSLGLFGAVGLWDHGPLSLYLLSITAAESLRSRLSLYSLRCHHSLRSVAVLAPFNHPLQYDAALATAPGSSCYCS
jgi:hypothetical protein